MTITNSKWIKLAGKLINTDHINSVEVCAPDHINIDWSIAINFNGDAYPKHISIKGESRAYEVYDKLISHLNAKRIQRPLTIEEDELAHND